MISTDDGEKRLLLGGCSLFWIGLAMGAVSFLLAKVAIPTGTRNVSDHDLMLANNLGFIFPPLLGFWIAVVRRSLLFVFSGIAVGLVIGCIYKSISGYDFLLTEGSAGGE